MAKVFARVWYSSLINGSLESDEKFTQASSRLGPAPPREDISAHRVLEDTTRKWESRKSLTNKTMNKYIRLSGTLPETY